MIDSKAQGQALFQKICWKIFFFREKCLTLRFRSVVFWALPGAEMDFNTKFLPSRFRKWKQQFWGKNQFFEEIHDTKLTISGKRSFWNPTVWSVRFLDFSRVDFFDTGFKNIGKMLEFLMQNTVTVQDNGISGEGSQLDIPSGSRLHQWEPNLLQHRICVFKNQIILPPMKIPGGIDLYNATFQGAGISSKITAQLLEKLQNERF